MTQLTHKRTVALYPWFKFAQNLVFWQAIWFLYFQNVLSAAEAILLYAVYDLSTMMLEVPSGWISDRLGRRLTLILSSLAGVLGGVLVVAGDGFAAFALAQVAFGTAAALASGTDSALLYEALQADGREDEIEAQELRAWRFSFAALATSAITGGAVALYFDVLTFAMSAVASAAAVVLCWFMSDVDRPATRNAFQALRTLWASLKQPVLVWLLALGVVMYGFSHLPFVFGQPFIVEALKGTGLQADAPLVSGAVTTSMMIISVLTSLIAERVRRRIGLTPLLLSAFALQIVIVAVLAATNSIAAIAVLLLRMVPDSMSRPFVLARIQPFLSDDSRATYLSVRALFARLTFAASLWMASLSVTTADQLPFDQISFILGWYALAGVVFLCALAISARALGSRLGGENG